MTSRRNTPPPLKAAARHFTAESALRLHCRHSASPPTIKNLSFVQPMICRPLLDSLQIVSS